MKQYCSYLRVSTQRQGAQGLGISAQREMCKRFIEQNNGEHMKEFMDVESGTHRDRKGLWQAIDYCKKNGCSLVIAKLDRMSRDVEFTFKVINTGIDIHFTDMPIVNSMILGVFAAVAQYEREMVSTRTKQALAVKKAQGCKLGAANEKYAANFNKKSEQKRKEECMKRGATKNARHMESRDVKALEKILRMVYPEATKGDMASWLWTKIDTKRENRMKVFSLMKNFKEMDESGGLFRRWRLDDSLWCESREAQQKLSGRFAALKKSVMTEHRNNMPYDN